jgi:hypothetical protein
MSIEHPILANNFDPPPQPDIGARRANHNLKYASLDYPSVIRIREIEHIDRNGEGQR